MLANAGHFDIEIDLDALREAATGGPREVLPMVEQYDARRAPAEPARLAAAWSTSPPARATRPR